MDTDCIRNPISRLIGNALSWQEINNEISALIFFFVIKLPELCVSWVCRAHMLPSLSLCPSLWLSWFLYFTKSSDMCVNECRSRTVSFELRVSLFLAPVGGWFYCRRNIATSYGYLVVIGKVTMTQRPGIVYNTLVYKDFLPLLLTCAKVMLLGS